MSEPADRIKELEQRNQELVLQLESAQKRLSTYERFGAVIQEQVNNAMRTAGDVMMKAEAEAAAVLRSAVAEREKILQEMHQAAEEIRFKAEEDAKRVRYEAFMDRDKIEREIEQMTRQRASLIQELQRLLDATEEHVAGLRRLLELGRFEAAPAPGGPLPPAPQRLPTYPGEAPRAAQASGHPAPPRPGLLGLGEEAAPGVPPRPPAGPVPAPLGEFPGAPGAASLGDWQGLRRQAAPPEPAAAAQAQPAAPPAFDWAAPIPPTVPSAASTQAPPSAFAGADEGGFTFGQPPAGNPFAPPTPSSTHQPLATVPSPAHHAAPPPGPLPPAASLPNAFAPAQAPPPPTFPGFAAQGQDEQELVPYGQETPTAEMPHGQAADGTAHAPAPAATAPTAPAPAQPAPADALGPGEFMFTVFPLPGPQAGERILRSLLAIPAVLGAEITAAGSNSVEIIVRYQPDADPATFLREELPYQFSLYEEEPGRLKAEMLDWEGLEDAPAEAEPQAATPEPTPAAEDSGGSPLRRLRFWR